MCWRASGPTLSHANGEPQQKQGSEAHVEQHCAGLAGLRAGAGARGVGRRLGRWAPVRRALVPGRSNVRSCRGCRDMFGCQYQRVPLSSRAFYAALRIMLRVGLARCRYGCLNRSQQFILDTNQSSQISLPQRTATAEAVCAHNPSCEGCFMASRARPPRVLLAS